MKPSRTIHVLAAAAVCACLTASCGNFSNEDLIFLAALPSRDQVALRVPGGSDDRQQQALSSQGQSLSSCEQDNLHCQAINLSNGINAAVFGLLNLVDAIANNIAPSKRQPGLRVWGPHYALDADATMRFEMTRKTVGKIDYFEYCLHAVKGKADLEAAEDLNCDREIDDSGLLRVLHGSFTPGEEQSSGARFGAGSLVFDLNAAQDAGIAKPDDKGRFTVDYDNTEDQTTIELHIREVTDAATMLPASADYTYHRLPDGSGDFKFKLNADFVGGFVFSELETLEIGAQWNAAEAGRADATVSDGDLVDTVVSATQCWDPQLEVVYYSDSAAEHPTIGQPDACAFSSPLP